MQSPLKTSARFLRRQRRGQSLVEFAVVALVSYLLLAAILEFGRLFFVAQVVQQTADLAARELSRTPLPSNSTFDQALQDQGVLSRVFNPDFLVIDVNNPPTDPWPVVNLQLQPLMFYETVNGQQLWRYPGALVPDSSKLSGYSVVIYTMQSDGSASSTPVSVLQEVTPGAFPLGTPPAGVSQSGMVTLQVNYPFQAATMSAFELDANGQPTTDVITVPTAASDDAPGLYSGTDGLGSQLAWAGKTVRPYQRLVTGQAIYRREVFSGP